MKSFADYFFLVIKTALFKALPIVTAIIVLSAFFLPFQGKKLCINSPSLKNPVLATSITRVINAFNRQKVRFTLGCGVGSIDLYLSSLDGDILAQTIPFGLIFSSKTEEAFQKRDYFIPFFHLMGRSITFNNKFYKKYKTNSTLFESTLVHELGHILGAPHQHLNPDNIMYPYISTSIDPDEFNLDTAVRQVLKISDRTLWTSYTFFKRD